MRIETLIKDIYATVNRKDNWFNESMADDLGNEVAAKLFQHYKQREGKGTLRLSKMVEQCPRALWYSVYHPELAEPLPAHAKLKFSYGHLIEAQTISLMKAAGHEVTGEQDELVVDGIKGHRDCVVDGCVVDVKSAATPTFKKFQDGSIATSDTFGYLDQLDGYVVGSRDDDLVRDKDHGYILAIDKTLGHMVLYKHVIRERSIRDRIERYKRIVSLDHPPDCTCGTTAEGESGNIKLDLKASYSAYKFCCFPNLRTFLYAKGPVYLTRVMRKPADHVVEVDKFGQATGYVN